MKFSKDSQLSRKCRVESCDIIGNFKKGICPKCSKAIFGNKVKRSNSIKKKGKTERQKAKSAIQKYARVRDANNQGVMECITCTKIITWNKNTDGGHCRPAHMEGTCFDERNINGQCKICNLRDMQTPEMIEEYSKAIDLKWGAGTYKGLFRASLVHSKRKADYEYQEIAKYYEVKAEGLIKEKGL
jgi:hypothetical protein